MSDLVGNPEDRFSRVAAHMNQEDFVCLYLLTFYLMKKKQLVRLNQISLVAVKTVLLMFDDITCMWFHQAVIEPVREKTNNLGSDEVGHKPSCTSTDDG